MSKVVAAACVVAALGCARDELSGTGEQQPTGGEPCVEGNPEVCDNDLDDDCDGHVDEGCDACAPTGPERCDNDLDDDCDGDVDEFCAQCRPHDDDCDGWTESGGDCDDEDPTIHPFAKDIIADGVDQNCDGLDCAGEALGVDYFIICFENRNWNESRSDCQTHGYHDLASVRSLAEQEFLEDLLYSSGGALSQAPWIGYNDLDNNHVWTWSDGWTGSFVRWSTGEPNNIGLELCVHFAWQNNTPGSGGWNNSICSYGSAWQHTSFICEGRDVLSLPQ
jgi:hypothetical protein